MGRSQVQRNRALGRPGQQGRGRGSGRGGGSGRTSSSRRPDPRTLGDNAFRFERAKINTDEVDAGGDEYYDGLLDDINFMSSGGGGEYFGPSYDNAKSEEEDFVDNLDGEVTDCWSVDIQSLAHCLSQIPLHERLNVPRHIGQHLQNMYGDMGSRKKTLAELREESKCVVSNTIPHKMERQITNNLEGDPLPKEDIISEQVDSAIQTVGGGKHENVEEACGGEEEEEDLEAWLDDMIS